MGNQQSNPQEYTPEQYKQYLEYQEQQKRLANIHQPIVNNSPKVNIPHVNLSTVQSQPKPIPIINNNNTNNVNAAYNNQKIGRTQIKPEIKNPDKKIIPDLQQKKYMPSVENHYQDTYQQRMIDNLSIGSKNMVSGATYTGLDSNYPVRNKNNDFNFNSKIIFIIIMV